MVCPPNRVTESGMEALLNDALPMAQARAAASSSAAGAAVSGTVW